jgi:hypothetical protein
LIELYINQLKTNLFAGFFVFLDRKKNLDTLLMLGMTVEDVIQVLMKLEVKNYSSGPLEDESAHGNNV